MRLTHRSSQKSVKQQNFVVYRVSLIVFQLFGVIQTHQGKVRRLPIHASTIKDQNGYLNHDLC